MKTFSKQKILTALCFFILLTLLFPPFESVHPNGGTTNAGYSFIMLAPESKWGGTASVDVEMLLTEWIAILLLAGIFWISRKESDFESLLDKTEISRIELAKKYEEGEISFVELETQYINLERVIRTQENR
jgi:hypothetical protein